MMLVNSAQITVQVVDCATIAADTAVALGGPHTNTRASTEQPAAKSNETNALSTR